MLCMTIRRTTRLYVAGVILLTGTVAGADFTLLNPPPRGEASISSIFEAFYSPGTAWFTTGSRLDSNGAVVDLTNGWLTATRVADFGFSGALDASAPFFGERTDQRWSASEFAFDAVARYAGYSQRFGYDLEGDEEGYVHLFDVSGSGMDVSGSARLTLKPGETVAWRRSGDQGGMWSSDIEHNPDGRDHMIAYRVTGYNDDLARWVLFWEDKPNAGDMDYNDLVVQVSTRAIPEPGMGLTIVLVCGAYVLIRRR